MFCEALTFLRDQLSTYLCLKASGSDQEVSFTISQGHGSEAKQICLKENAVTLLMTNFEEERTFKSGSSSNQSQIHSPISLNLQVLFVPNFESYEKSLKHLSLIINFFQSHTVFNHQNSPALDPGIATLNMELLNLSNSDQRSLWGILGRSYIPSALYKVRMITIYGDEIINIDSQIKTIQTLTLKNTR